VIKSSPGKMGRKLGNFPGNELKTKMTIFRLEFRHSYVLLMAGHGILGGFQLSLVR